MKGRINLQVIESLTLKAGFSESEKAVADYILANKEEVLEMPIQQLASACFTSPSIVIRMCKKIGIGGYAQLKITLATELQRIDEPFIQSVNVDFPFAPDDFIYELSKKVFQLTKEALEDSYRRFSPANFKKAVHLIQSHDRLAVFGVGDCYLSSQRFANRMMKISRPVLIPVLSEEHGYLAGILTRHDCALMISSIAAEHLLFWWIRRF